MSRNTSYDELLDEIYPSFTIGELTFCASDILYNCDPIAYRLGLSDYEAWDEEDEEYDYYADEEGYDETL